MMLNYWCKIPVSVPWTSTGHWFDLKIWLLNNVPTSDYDHVGRDGDNHNNRIVTFRFEQDALLFALRWA